MSLINSFRYSASVSSFKVNHWKQKTLNEKNSWVEIQKSVSIARTYGEWLSFFWNIKTRLFSHRIFYCNDRYFIVFASRNIFVFENSFIQFVIQYKKSFICYKRIYKIWQEYILSKSAKKFDVWQYTFRLIYFSYIDNDPFFIIILYFIWSKRY